jgi:glycine cleavage system H protein
MYPEELRYTRDHEWVRIEADGRAVLGITHYAQDQLGDIVFLDLPEAGTALEPGQELGTVESVKAVSEIYAPLAGEVVEANAALGEQPELVNQDPYGEGWLLKVTVGDPAAVEQLLDAAAYKAHVDGLGG